jgi:hypothetical protein
MPTEDPGTQTLPRLLSVPGLMAVALFGISVIVVPRLFGPENILREIITELLASFGSTILLVALFGFFFRTGLQRLLRRAPGGETFEESAERLRELQDFDHRGRESEGPQDGEKLDRIEVGVSPGRRGNTPAGERDTRPAEDTGRSCIREGRSDPRIRPSLTYRGALLPAASVLDKLMSRR